MKKNSLVNVPQKDNEAGFSLVPKTLEEAMKFSEMIAKSDLAPKDYKGKSGNVLIAIQMGHEIGLKPMQSLQNIAVINGRATVWGDAVPAIIKVSPGYEWMEEWIENKAGERVDGNAFKAVCVMKRKGHPEQRRAFSMDEAAKAKLTGKAGPWSQYPDRMLQMRARSFAARDVFPDALKGLSIREEVEDYHGIEDVKTNEDLVTPPFNVPTVAVPSVTVDAEIEPEVIEIEKSDPARDVELFAQRIEQIANSFEAKNWFAKHLVEISALPQTAQDVVTGLYKGRLLDLDAQGSEDFADKFRHAENIEVLDNIWLDFEETKPKGVELVKMRRVRDSCAAEIRKTNNRGKND